MKEVPIYQVYAVHYAWMPEYPAPFMMYLSEPEKKYPMDWSFWVIKGGGHIILVDTGSNEKMAEAWGLQGYKRSDQLLYKLGIKPEDVTDIILTHLHWDHAGNCKREYYPAATIWLQKVELEFAAGEGAQSDQGKIGIQEEDVLRLVKYNWDGHLKLIDGDKEVYPGINCYLAMRTHTYGSQFVSINTASGVVVLAQDLAYRFDGIDKMIPTGTGLDMYEGYKALIRIREVASSTRLVVPGHDPAVYERWTTPGEGVAEIK